LENVRETENKNIVEVPNYATLKIIYELSPT